VHDADTGNATLKEGLPAPIGDMRASHERTAAACLTESGSVWLITPPG
jgi:hypothetical protein